MKKILLSLMLVFLLITPVSAATKPLTNSQLKAQVSTLQKQIATLNSQLDVTLERNRQYESYFQPMVDLVSSTKATNIELRSLVQQYFEATQKAVTIINQYKSMCSAAASSYSTPAPTIISTPVPTVTPIIKCFNGSVVECFDYSQFSPELISQLNLITQKPISMQSIVNEQLRAIHNAGF